MRRFSALAAVSGGTLLAASLTLATSTAAGAARTNTAPSTGSDAVSGASNVDLDTALVRLSLDPLTTSPRTRPPQGKKVDFSSAAVTSERARLAAQRNDFKTWLRSAAPGAQVTGEHDLAVNAVTVQLNGSSLATLRSGPAVLSAEYQGLYHPTADKAYLDLSLIQAQEAWAGHGGEANAGKGVKVAIVDTGIDITNPCFSDGTVPRAGQLTNSKVIVAKVFANKAANLGFDASPAQAHGTHVAGTVACNFGTTAAVDGVTITNQLAGVAPAALLGSYNVFPGNITNARSEDIVNALEAAYADGMDVDNMSLGGGAAGAQDLLTVAVDNLDAANMLSAVAAGNDGPGHFTVGSPGSAAGALTAGASTVGHFVGVPVTVGGVVYGAATGDFRTLTTDFPGTLRVARATDGTLDKACSALASSYTGSADVVLISRGVCSFSTKIRNAQAAGAEVVLVANNVAGDPVAMGSDGTAGQPTVPAYMVAKSTGAALLSQGGSAATVAHRATYQQTGNDNIMAGFSSQGPTDVTYRVKPDVVAPGVNVLSSIPAAFCAAPPCFAFFQGTSMATPHLAGSAAVLRGQHPNWSAAQVRSAVVNTAGGTLTDFRTGLATVTDPNIVGAGLEDLLNASNASVALAPVSTSFGSLPSGSGQTRTAQVVVSDPTGSGGNYDVSVAGTTGGVTFTPSATSVTVPPGGSATLTVTMTAPQGVAPGDKRATLTVGSSHSVLYVFVK